MNNLELLISKVENLFGKPKYESDDNLIQKIYNNLQLMKKNNITEELLDEVESNINVLNQKYEDLFDLENLYDIIKYRYKKQLKQQMVSKLREKNRKKRL